MSPNYRSRIYESYASNFQGASETFDKNAAWYWGRIYRYHLRGWLPHDKGAQIVDLGCGGGKLLYFFKRVGYSNITGIDISEEQVGLARQVVPGVEQSDVLEWLKSHSKAFDLITAFDIIEHLHKDEVLLFLDACFSALKPGGRLILQTPNADSPMMMSVRYGDFTHEVAFNTNVLLSLLTMVGFEPPVSRELGPVPWGHSGKSTVRYLIWQVIRAGIKFRNLVETGHGGSGIYTRVFLITCIKQ